MESAQISGKVFRFLLTMHPSLTKQERERYKKFDADKWYPWTVEIATEFTDLMRRSPRDSTFGRGLAMVASKGLPEGTKLTPTELVAGLPSLPAAYVGPGGSGFEVDMDRPGYAEVYYRGMPGFSNVCIAISAELTQRLQTVGARGLEVKHVEGCRLQGADACKFEVRWVAESDDAVAAPAAAPATRSEPTYERQSEDPSARSWERPSEPAPRAAESWRYEEPSAASRVAVRPAPAAPRSAPPAWSEPPATGGTANDLFEQLRSRLVEAERQSSRHAELESHIAELEARSAELEAALEAAQADAAAARHALADLKRRIRDLVA